MHCTLTKRRQDASAPRAFWRFLRVCLWIIQTTLVVTAQTPGSDAAGDLQAKMSSGDDGRVAETEEANQGEQPPEQEGGVQWWKSVGENVRLSADVISRVESNPGVRAFSSLNAVGLDFHSVATSKSGNIGTLVLQPYLVRRDLARPIMAHLEGPNDWEVELHDFYFNLTRWGTGRTNIKLGHFDVPFGLEPLTDTHFKIYQLMPMENLGMKKDWGVSLNGVFPNLDYEVALTRGSGFQFDAREDNYAVSGRIGTPSDRNWILGIAAFQGRVLNQRRNVIVPRKRIGVDATWIMSQFTLKGEASFGKDFDRTVFHNLVELDWASVEETLSAYIQMIYLRRQMPFGWVNKVAPRVGVNWVVGRHWSLEGQYGPEMVMMMTRPEDWEFRVQLRYYR